VLVTQLDPTIDASWDALVTSFPGSTFFHGSPWSRVIKYSYDYEPHYLAMHDSGGRCMAIFPFFLIEGFLSVRRLICLPFTDFCGPLVRQDADLWSVYTSLEAELIRTKVAYAEIRGPLPDDLSNGPRIESRLQFVGFVLDLSRGIEQLWSGLKANSVRYRIRRAQKEGVTVLMETSEEAMRTFCTLNRLTRRRHGIVPQPDRFFQCLYDQVVSQGHGCIFTARMGAKPIASSVFLFDEMAMISKYSASDERFSECGANHLVLWRAIEWATARKLRSIDLGRTSLSNEGLLMYKKGWGARAIPLRYSYWPRLHGASRVTQNGIAYRVAKRLVPMVPLSILQSAGNLLYRFFG